MATPLVQAGRWRASMIMPDAIASAHGCTDSGARRDHSSARRASLLAICRSVFRAGAQKCHGTTLDRILQTVRDAGAAGRVHL
jgi:hypothetical protein